MTAASRPFTSGTRNLRAFSGVRTARKNWSAAVASGIFQITVASTARVVSTVRRTGSRVSTSTAGRSNDCTRRSSLSTASTGQGALRCSPASVAPSWMAIGSPNRMT
jgi:hypothetical protein